MKKIKHIWNAAFVAAATLATTVPFVCSCKYKAKEVEPTLKTIDINLPKDDFYIQEYRTVTSDPITVKCLDDHGQPIATDLEWVITDEQGTSGPNWIKVNENNQLVITAVAEVSEYRFKIFAQDKQTQIIKSEAKIFSVEIHGSPLVPPESLEIINDSGLDYLFMREVSSIHIKAKGYREGFDPDEVSGECNWSVVNIVGKKSWDLYGRDLFRLNFNEDGCNITLSNDIDSTYLGTYTISISAVSTYSRRVSTISTIDLTICNGTYYTHAESGCILTRTNIYESWTISQLVRDTTIVVGLPDIVLGYPVVKVARNLCSSSLITGLVEVRLPNTVVEIEPEAFANQTNLKTIAMPGVKYVGSEAFKNCTNLTLDENYTQPVLRYVGAKAFYFCEKFTLDTANQFYYIGEFAFCNTGLKKINLGVNISYIETDAFTSCQNLEEIMILNEIPPKLGGALFYGSTNPQCIKVLSSCLNAYLSAPDWQPYTDLLTVY